MPTRPTGPPPGLRALLPAHCYVQPPTPMLMQPSPQLLQLPASLGIGLRPPPPVSSLPQSQGLTQPHPLDPWGPSMDIHPPAVLSCLLPPSTMQRSPGPDSSEVHKQLEDTRHQLMTFHQLFQLRLDGKAAVAASQALVPEVPNSPASLSPQGRDLKEREAAAKGYRNSGGVRWTEA